MDNRLVRTAEDPSEVRLDPSVMLVTENRNRPSAVLEDKEPPRPGDAPDIDTDKGSTTVSSLIKTCNRWQT